MQFTLSWLKDFLQTDAPLEQISERLTALGLEVEKIVDKSALLTPFKTAHILEAHPHPNADKLRVCKVDTGNGHLQIVCGAPNARAGITVVLAPVGSVIPTNGLKIKASSIRDVESNGMLCSARELGIGDDHNGIIELAADIPLGTSFAEISGLNDPVIEIAITPNRGDCLGVYGIARDLAASGIGTLKKLDIKPTTTTAPCPIQVTAVDESSYFIGRHFCGVSNKESPVWLKQRLEAIGINPISTLVDITNYISFSFGRPLHVYDADKVTGNITIRPSMAGESFTALDKKTHIVPQGQSVIADNEGVISLPGIIGGERTGCSDTTSNVFLESAFFTPLSVITTGRALQIETDSRYRFERTVDKGFVQAGADIASAMILELCGGTASQYVYAGDSAISQRVISFNLSKVETFGGLKLDEKTIQDILTRLGFVLSDNQVTVPSWRNDVEGEADLVEEILRVYGYDALVSTPLPTSTRGFAPALSPGQRRISTAKRLLAARGFRETVTWSFIPPDIATLFGGGQAELCLQNPISIELASMRPSLVPNLLDAAKRNAARGYHDIALFEAGPQFAGTAPEAQQLVIAGIRTGSNAPKNAYHDARPLDAFDCKADLFALLKECGVATERLNITTDAPDWYHPGRSAVIRLGNKPLALFGKIHPAVLHRLDIKSSVVAFELFIEAVPVGKPKQGRKPAPSWSDYQAVERDFAFIVANDTQVEQLFRAIRNAEKQLITNISLFDIYHGKGLPEGKKSLGLTVTLQAMDRTLTEQEIEAASQKIIASVEKNTGGYLRK